MICSVFFIVSLAQGLFDLPEAWCTLTFNPRVSAHAHYWLLRSWWINQPDGQQSRNTALSMDCTALFYCSSLRVGREISTDEGIRDFSLTLLIAHPCSRRKNVIHECVCSSIETALPYPAKLNRFGIKGSPWEV